MGSSGRGYMRVNAGVHLWNTASTIKGGQANANADVVAACKYHYSSKWQVDVLTDLRTQ